MVKKYKINYKKDEKEFKSGGSVLDIYKGVTGALGNVAPLVNKPQIPNQKILDDFKKNVTDYLASRKLVSSKKRNNNNDKVLISVKGTNDDDEDNDDEEEEEKEEEYIIINIGEDKYTMLETTFKALLDGGYLEKIDK